MATTPDKLHGGEFPDEEARSRMINGFLQNFMRRHRDMFEEINHHAQEAAFLQASEGIESLSETLPHALAPHPLSFSGIPTFYLLLPSAPMHRQLDPEHEEKILENIKKIIEYMYSSVGLPEQRSMRESVDEPTLSPEAAGLDLKRLTFVKKLIEKGVFSEFPSE